MLPETVMRKNRITPRQLQLLKAIEKYRENFYYSPTMGELAQQLHISRSTVFEHISVLRRKALLTAHPGKARSLTLTSKARGLLNHLSFRQQEHPAEQKTGIALLGTVAAGTPIEAIEHRQELSLTSEFGDNDELFALQVTGDSMLEENIREGDYVVCRRRPVAEEGQLVVAAVDDGSVTLKRFYKEKTRVRLQPANKDYQPIYSDNCRIEAVVVGLLRKF